MISQLETRLPRFRNRLHSVLVRFGTEQFGRFLLYAPSPAKLLLFVNSLQTATLMSRVSSAIEHSWLVTGLVTVNGNRGGVAHYTLRVVGINHKVRSPRTSRFLTPL